MEWLDAFACKGERVATVFREKVAFLKEESEAKLKKFEALEKENVMLKAVIRGAYSEKHIKAAFDKGLDQGESGVLGRDADGDVRQFDLFGQTWNVDDLELSTAVGLPSVVGGWDATSQNMRGVGHLPVAPTAEGCEAIYTFKKMVHDTLADTLAEAVEQRKGRERLAHEHLVVTRAEMKAAKKTWKQMLEEEAPLIAAKELVSRGPRHLVLSGC